MRKSFLAFGILSISFAAAMSANAALPSIQPKITPQLEQKIVPTLTTTTKTTIEPTIIKPDLNVPKLIDPVLVATNTQKIPTPKPLPIDLDPGKLGLLQPLPIPPIEIPPELLKGPTITDIALSTDGKMLRVTWTTSKAATTQIDYGKDTSYGSTLSDKTLTTSHDILLAVVPGDLHLKLTSADSLNRKTTTPDFVAPIPQVAAQGTEPDTATATTATNPAADDSDSMVDDEGIAQDAQTNQNVTAAAATSVANGISTTEAFLIGLAVLLAIIVVILLVARSKKQN